MLQAKFKFSSFQNNPTERKYNILLELTRYSPRPKALLLVSEIIIGQRQKFSSSHRLKREKPF